MLDPVPDPRCDERVRLAGQMSNSSDRIRVVLVSPADVSKERAASKRVIEELNRGVARNRLVLWRWETDALPGLHLEGPQGLIDELSDLPSADLVIGVFWKRFGTPTHDADSGTEHELRRAWAAWQRQRSPEVMVYFSERRYMPKTAAEALQWARVLEFKDQLIGEQLWWPYTKPVDFERLLREHLTRYLEQLDAAVKSPPAARIEAGEGLRFNAPMIIASSSGRDDEQHAPHQDGDERTFLQWLVEHGAEMRTAGLGTSRHLQLPLADVFVPPQGVREAVSGARWQTRAHEQLADLTERLRGGTISPEEYEARVDRLRVKDGARLLNQPERVSVTREIGDVACAVVLGEPGSGKTTLLRYLALRHAQALLDGESIVSLGAEDARLPIYVRVGEFSRWPERDRGLGAFLSQFATGTMQCPLEPAPLQLLFASALQAGRCLILIDGLDEVGNAAERVAVVECISTFAASQVPQGNRLICTSRISGYLAAPLPTSFAGVRLLEMDDDAIEAFLRGYVPAIERSEAPDKAAAIVAADAERAIARLLEAFARSPGVRRLAANPLLLTALLLVERTHGDLPQRRVDAYKAIADALGHTWRAYHGIPDADLPDERRLTGWLARLAEWMHAERPEGSATLRDLLQILGPSWAQLNRQLWDPSVLQEADPANTEPGSGILQFVEQVDRHCGLLVERAPRRWGFAHLTFEEFYAGRALAFGRVQDRPARIRQHLHDVRYDEPILLALGLVGRDFGEDIDELFQSALLARGDEARRLRLTPSRFEDLLGRDIRFALRALADDIPAAPDLIDELLTRTLDEALHATGRGQFSEYREALLERFQALKSTAAGTRLVELLVGRVDADLLADRDQHSRFLQIAACCVPHPVISVRLAEIVATSPSLGASRAARVLAAQGRLPTPVSRRLVELIERTDDPFGASHAAEVLAGQGALPSAVSRRLAELIASTDDAFGASYAAEVLAGQGALPIAVSRRLVELIASTDDAFGASHAAEVLTGQGALPSAVSQRLVGLIASTDDPNAAKIAADVLVGQGALPPFVSQRLAELIATSNDFTGASHAANALAAQDSLPSAVSQRLVELIASTRNPLGASHAARALAGQDRLPLAVSERLGEVIANTSNPTRASYAAEALSGQGALPPAARQRLTELIANTMNPLGGSRAARVLAGDGGLPPAVGRRLVELIERTDDPFAVCLAAEVLASQGTLPAAVSHRLAKLIESTDYALGADRAAKVLAGQEALPPVVSQRLAELIASTNDPVRERHAAEALAGQGTLPEAVSERLAESARIGRTSAFHTLWQSCS